MLCDATGTKAATHAWDSTLCVDRTTAGWRNSNIGCSRSSSADTVAALTGARKTTGLNHGVSGRIGAAHGLPCRSRSGLRPPVPCAAVAAAPTSIASGRAAADQPTLWGFQWQWIPGREAAQDGELVEDCLQLYEAHYGTWGPNGRRPGELVRISCDYFLKLIDLDDAWLACAYRDESLVGYCVALKTEVPGRGRLAWVSQLVVDSNYRTSRIATTLLYGVWQFGEFYAWGLATANPFAVRALETATRRACRAALITRRAPEILEHLQGRVPYLPARLVHEDGVPRPRVDTDFQLDHDGVPGMLKKAARRDRPWALHGIGEGEEWLACTFAVQPAHRLDDKRLADLQLGADGIWIHAYEGMTLDEDHGWHRHAEAEINLLLELTGMASPATVLDVGCGAGRHAAELAGRGFQVTGIDISRRLIARASERASAPNVTFAVADARKHVPVGPYDLALCLYDVLGSSARSEDDDDMIRTIASALRPGGHLVLGVMNTSVTADLIPHEQRPTTNVEFIEALERLPASDTMESTGAVFDPSLIVLYHEIHYRKEQFPRGGRSVPPELLVRDRRFTAANVAALMGRAGLEVVEVRPVQAGQWSREPVLSENDQRAKELLVVARKPTGSARP